MPTNTKARFAANAKATRKTRFSPKPEAAGDGDATPPVPRKSRKAGPRWVTDQHVAAADKISGKAEPGGTDSAPVVGPYELERRRMIRDRNRRRRYPWLIALGAIAWGLLTGLASMFFAWTTSVPAEAVAAVMAPIALVAALVTGLRQRHWLPELAVAGLSAAGVTYWIGVAGLSWLVVLVALVVTVAGGARWWKAHPIGPGVPRLEPYRPEQQAEPQPEPEPEASKVPPPEKDPYCIAWHDNNATGDGKAKGSKLTNRRDDEFTATYDVELKRGAQDLSDLMANRAKLAGGLGEDTERVLFKKAPRGSGASKAVLTIITKDPTEKTRFFTGPRVEDGVIKGVARSTDGRGEVDITMWKDSGAKATMIVGSTGGGKSGAANILACNALSTGLLNMLYADPKGNSSTALATRARVAIIGRTNVLKLPHLARAMLEARAEIAAELGQDQMFPTVEIPSWMILHDEYSLIASDPLAQRVWTEAVNTVRAYGVWLVALNQSQNQSQWGSDHARSAFASQVVAFRVQSKSGSDLVPGLNFDPAELPVDDAGEAIPGMAVHAYRDAPVRWDFLPSKANADKMAARGEPAPPYITETAFDEFFRQPEPHWREVEAIESILGPAFNGRWQVGGPGATHEFPESLDGSAKAAPSARPKGRWGQRGPAAPSVSTDSKLTPAQAEVLAIVRGGTAETGEILNAAKAGRSSVFDALDALSDLGLIRKTEHGIYKPTARDA